MRAPRTLVLVAVLCLGAAGVTRAQAPRTAPREALWLIVRVEGAFASGDVKPGSGIVLGAGADSLYIITACHVVTNPGDSTTSVRVNFVWDSLHSVGARLRNRAPRCPDRGSLDLAVLAVPRAADRQVDARVLAPDRRGDARALRLGDPVRAIGCPLEECWGLPGSPDDFVRLDSLEIVFQSDVVQPGSSGGGLFNAWWEVIGMVTEDVPPRAMAIRIDRVVAQLEAWRVPVGLRRPSIPRGGYHEWVGVTVFTMTPLDRIPAGRIIGGGRLSAAVAWHAGVTRFAPADRAINAAVAGIGLRKGGRRFAIDGFVEAGFGRTEGRHDLGGYYVASGADTTYVPVWQRVQRDGLLTGFGGSLSVVVRRGTIAELLVGRWSFPAPAPLPSFGETLVGFGIHFAR